MMAGGARLSSLGCPHEKPQDTSLPARRPCPGLLCSVAPPKPSTEVATPSQASHLLLVGADLLPREGLPAQELQVLQAQLAGLAVRLEDILGEVLCGASAGVRAQAG